MNKKNSPKFEKFSDTSDLFVLNQVATAFVDSEKISAVRPAVPITTLLPKKATALWQR